MITRTLFKNVVTVVAAAALVVAGRCPVQAGEPTMKEKADYNQSMTALLGGVSQVMAADAGSLKAAGDYLEKLTSIRQLQEQIRTARMANDMKEATDFYAKKKMHSDHRQGKQLKRLPADKLQQLARQAAPARLNAAEISSGSSRVNWPHTLNGECFSCMRAEIERLWAERTVQNSGEGSQSCADIQSAVEQMKTQLKSQVQVVDPTSYLTAKKFLDGLAFEARFTVTPSVESVASK